ncbi:MAG TPA: ADOP family duplicated permease [Thermoanaerobaculia bacterium]|nr:ADOP family duplicated permease [Thermoanaerobaculia bacterium]
MWHETRQAVRQLRRNPLVTVTAIITLAVGVGAVTTAFTVVRGVLSPLAYPGAARLVRLYATQGALQESPNPRLAALWNRLPVSHLDAADWRQGSRALRGIGLYLEHTAVLEGAGEPLEVAAAKIDADLLAVLGVAPALGRSFDRREVARRERLVILAHELWRSAFGADERIVGKTLRLDGQQHVVLGVMPAGFALPGREHRLWVPAAPSAADLAHRDELAYAAIGRLAPRTTVAAAQAEVDRLASALAARYPETNSDRGVRLVPLLETVTGDSRRLLGLLAAAAGVVLLVACVNLAHLLLAQALERRSDVALRLAIGASRWQLLRQSGLEMFALALCGGAGGLALAMLARRALPSLLAAELPRLETIGADRGVVLFAFAAGLGAMLVGGVLPVVFAPGAAPRTALAERRLVRLAQDALVVVEVALALILTAGALTLVASWLRLEAVDPGFDARHVLVQEVRLPAWSYPDEIRRGEIAARLLADLAALPGVSAAALTSRLPLTGPAEVWGFRVVGEDTASGEWTQGPSALMQFVTPGYFRLLRIPVLAGRVFDGVSPPGAHRLVMVNRTLARRHWPGRSAVGARVRMREQDFRVEGVFGDARQQGVAEEPGELMVQPWSQGPATTFAALVRVGGRPLDYAPTVRRTLRRLDPALPLPAAADLEELVDRSRFGPRSRALLVGLCAGVALLLALIGTYGVMAYGIARRRHDIAVRMAVGADRRTIRRWALRRTLALALAGVAMGAVGALAAGRLLAGSLYGAATIDPPGLTAAALLLVLACLAAGYLPARRASRIDPAATLRSE